MDLGIEQKAYESSYFTSRIYCVLQISERRPKETNDGNEITNIEPA